MKPKRRNIFTRQVHIGCRASLAFVTSLKYPRQAQCTVLDPRCEPQNKQDVDKNCKELAPIPESGPLPTFESLVLVTLQLGRHFPGLWPTPLCIICHFIRYALLRPFMNTCKQGKQLYCAACSIRCAVRKSGEFISSLGDQILIST